MRKLDVVNDENSHVPFNLSPPPPYHPNLQLGITITIVPKLLDDVTSKSLHERHMFRAI